MRRRIATMAVISWVASVLGAAQAPAATDIR
jgi:hypothetical protein